MAEPLVVSDWKYGITAVKVAYWILKNSGSDLDAVEEGIISVEEDISVESVGSGGIHNLDGVAELDASIIVRNTYRGQVLQA